ncbi:hypothetical protein SUGI_0196020 [Cryptomeria japonica]|nr:hypothetical protein SUGI_0196020 [Cryptomeria japonica]
MEVFRGESVMIKPYSAPTPTTQALKEGLAKVLTHYRVLAGRYTKQQFNGHLAIDLNDEGAVLIQGKADGSIADTMPFLPSPLLLDLVPPTPPGVKELILVQITRFICGGLVIGIALHHHVADGHATFTFINSWGKAVRGESIQQPPWIHDRSLLKARDLPQQVFDHYEYNTIAHKKSPRQSIRSTKVFHFDGIFLDKLKSKVKQSNKEKKNYTTFEVLVAHLWKCISGARGLDGDLQTKASIPIDGRKRINPPIPEEYFGNVVYESWAQTTVSELINGSLDFVTELIHKSITKVDNDFIRSAIDFFELSKEITGPLELDDTTNVIATSWLRFPYYEFHFGMGKPVYVGPSMIRSEGLIILYDSYTKEGSVDVMVCLLEPHMAIFEQTCFQI